MPKRSLRAAVAKVVLPRGRVNERAVAYGVTGPIYLRFGAQNNVAANRTWTLNGPRAATLYERARLTAKQSVESAIMCEHYHCRDTITS